MLIKEKDTIFVNFLGDVMLGETLENYKRGVKNCVQTGNINPFEHCKHDLEISDFNIANLECVIANKSSKNMPFSEFMRVPKNFINILKNSNIHAVNLANNHTLDHGNIAFEEMVKILNEYGIKTFGYSKKYFFQKNLCICTVKNIKIGILGYNLANLEKKELQKFYRKIIKVIRRERSKVQILVVSLHWGYEYLDFPAPIFIKIGKKLLKNGVNILYGHHSHQIQGVIKYRNKIFAPSLGNFIFDDRRRKNRLTAILKVSIEQNLDINFTLIPFYINRNFQPEKNHKLLPKLIKLNKKFEKLILNNQETDKKWKIIAEKKVRLGHFKNSIRVRILFLINLRYYYPYIRKIIKAKICKEKPFKKLDDVRICCSQKG